MEAIIISEKQLVVSGHDIRGGGCMAIELLPRFQPEVFSFREMVRKRAEYNAGLSYMQFLDIFLINK